MSPLSFILIIASVLFLIFAIDGLQRRKLNFIHFLIFVGGAAIILFSLFYPGFQDKFASIFGVARVADIIVYGSLIVLGYFYFELLNELTKQKFHASRLVSALAIQDRRGNHGESTGTDKDTFCFLIRAYNEQETIANTIREIHEAGYKNIVVVNDGSTDRTEEEVKQFSNVILLSHIINRGGGAANKTGISFLSKHAKEMGIERIVTFDADGQMDTNDMNTFRDMIKHNSSVKAFLGSRFIKGGEAENMPFGRKIILWGSKLVTLIFNRLSVSDPHNGYRVLHVNILHNIHLSSDGMTYASELLDCIRRNKIPYKEVPVRIRYTEYSLGKGQKNGNAFRILFEMIYKKLFFK